MAGGIGIFCAVISFGHLSLSDQDGRDGALWYCCFAQVIVTYVSLVVNFGFNLTGAKEIASNLANPDKISEIVSSVFINKFAIWLVCFFVYLLMISSFSFFSEHYALYFFSFFLTLNELLFPIWFYQGIEKMKYVTCVNVAIRLFFIGAIFIFVRQETDYIYVPVLNSAGAVLAGIVSLYILLRVEKVKLIAVSKERLNFYFKEALPLFVSSLSIRIYQNANKIVVGSFWECQKSPYSIWARNSYP